MKYCIEVDKKELCTGCGACINICPMDAISLHVDEEGFWYPDINEDMCTQCGKCVNVCPILQTVSLELDSEQKKQVNLYAAWSLNPEIRFLSTSGGIFSELAMAIIDRGGSVCGAIYDDEWIVRHHITDTRDGIEKLRQSKYVQSDMGNIYQEIGNCLRQNKELLFCGTPCQCEGVFYYCHEEKIDTRKLYIIDFICRGSNSPKVYQKFLKELEEKYQAKVSKVWFKNKAYGWNCFSTRIDFDNGKFYLRDRYHDTYIRGYIEENLYIRPSCTDCRFKGFHRISDITLADFWGIKLSEHTQESDGGTSMVMVSTEKGARLWNLISQQLYWEKKQLEEVLEGNVCFYDSVQQGEHREQFMSDLDNMSVIDNIERFLKKTNN